MHQGSSIEKRLEELERSLHLTDVRAPKRAADLLAEEFVEFGSSGRRFNRAQIIDGLRAATPATVTATQFKAKLLAPHIVLLTYRAHRHSEPPVHTLRSSIWMKRQGRWQMVFHQGTITAAPS